MEKEEKEKKRMGLRWGGVGRVLRYDIISSLFATAFSEENQC